MPANLNVLREPWTADIDDLDAEAFRIVRGADMRPLTYIDRHLSHNAQEDLARLITATPTLLRLNRQIFFAPSHVLDQAPLWEPKHWKRWREEAGPILAELWVTT